MCRTTACAASSASTCAPGAAREVAFELTARDLALVDETGRRVVEPGRFRASIGGSQPDDRSRALTGSSPVSVDFDVV